MGSFASKPTIDSLPDELLCLIFDRMDLKTVQMASLTCRRWHDIIFSSDYIERFEFLISFDWSDDENGAIRSKQVMENLKTSVRYTQRCYTKMSLYAADNGTPICDIAKFWKLIHPKITENITSLELHFTWCCTIPAMRELSYEIKLLPKLRSLRVVNDHDGVYDYAYRINSKTVKHLEMIGPYLFEFHIPELESFVGPASALIELDRYPKLKHLTLWDGDWRSRDKTVFHGLKQVETLQLLVEIEDSMLAAICDTCTTLKYLYVARPVGFDVNSISLQRLSKLRNLRELVFDFDIDLPHSLPSDFDLGLSKLTQLELLNLGSSVLEAPTLRRLPKSDVLPCVSLRRMKQ
ncbi:uncharacterized protein LOC118465494 [Anopheles albimanus]|uniref:uncharacterized protein LOC118465494 n=1 Tax=Anopheles albimanus TaxID=7167 RepID=UPI00163FFEBF|nr:uncharacterized protein LOC118465494 [Anopheles albimanus]